MARHVWRGPARRVDVVLVGGDLAHPATPVRARAVTAAAEGTGYRFVLYVAGRTSRSQRALESLRRLCEERLGRGGFDLRVVDVLEEAGEAEAARIIVAPTVVRTHPEPVLRVMGDLSASVKLAEALGLPPGRSVDGDEG